MPVYPAHPHLEAIGSHFGHHTDPRIDVDGLIGTLYGWLVSNHTGQWSDEYAVLSQLIERFGHYPHTHPYDFVTHGLNEGEISYDEIWEYLVKWDRFMNHLGTLLP